MERKRNQCPSDKWTVYFRSIQAVCPWSLGAYQQGLIDVVAYKGYRIALDSPLKARIYITDLTTRRLKKLASDYDIRDQENEWFWSHPIHREYSAPFPILIQQNRQYLEEMRRKYAK